MSDLSENADLGVLPDNQKPTAGAMRLTETLRRGGWAICLLVVPMVVMEQLSREATGTLAPDIRNAFGISDALFVAVAGFSGVTLTLGGPVLAWLAERVRRKTLVVASASLGTAALIGAGLAQNTWQLFIAYALTGAAAAYSHPVFGSMIADAYPVEGRGRIYSLHAMGTPLGQAIGPALAGTIASVAGSGPESWRWAYLGLAIPYAVLAIVAALFLKEPARGQSDRGETFGDTRTPGGAVKGAPNSTIRAFRLMLKVRTFLFMCLGLGVLGLALYTVPLQMSLLLGDEYKFDAFTRGAVFSLVQIPVVIAMVIAGQQFDRLFRRRPEATIQIAGSALLAYGVLIAGGIWFQPVWLLIACYLVSSMLVGLPLVAILPLVASVTPFHLRAQAFSFIPVFTFLMGGFFGSIFAGIISGSFGPRPAIAIAVTFSAFIAGTFFLRSRKYLATDMAAADAVLKAHATSGNGIPRPRTGKEEN